MGNQIGGDGRNPLEPSVCMLYKRWADLGKMMDPEVVRSGFQLGGFLFRLLVIPSFLYAKFARKRGILML